MYLPKLAGIAIIITAALVQASYLQERTSSSIEILVKDLQNLTANTQQIKDVADAWVPADGYASPSGVFGIFYGENALMKSVNQSSFDCNIITVNFSDTDTATLLNKISDFATLFQVTGQGLIDKKPNFDSVPFTDVIVVGGIGHLPPVIKSLSACFMSHLPSNNSAIAQNYFKQINSTCADLCDSYGVPCDFYIICHLPDYKH